MKHRFDLKHALTARARAEDKENKARKDLKVPETSCGWPERSCRLSRVTCVPKWQRWIGSIERLRRLETLWST